MTDDQIQTMRSDIAYLKDLAVDGQRSSSKVGGAILAAAGLVYTIASLAQWALATGRLDMAQNASLFIWLGATVVFLILAFAAKTRWGASGARGPVSRANRTVWIGVGLGIGAVAAAFIVAANTTGDWMIMNLMASIVLAFYGAAWIVNAAVNQARAPALLSAGCFISAALIGLLVNSPNLLLAYAAALVLFALIPGLVYMRKDGGAA